MDTMSSTDPVPATRAFACPRCHGEVTEAWYGPCNACRTDLRLTDDGAFRLTDHVDPRFDART